MGASAARRARAILFDLAAKELKDSSPDLVAAEGKIHLLKLPGSL
jgi:hypothetical protein